MLNRGEGREDPSGSTGLGPTHDLGLGAQLPFDGIEPHAAAHDHGQEADLSSIPKPQDLQRLLDIHGPCFDGSLISQVLPPSARSGDGTAAPSLYDALQ